MPLSSPHVHSGTYAPVASDCLISHLLERWWDRLWVFCMYLQERVCHSWFVLIVWHPPVPSKWLKWSLNLKSFLKISNHFHNAEMMNWRSRTEKESWRTRFMGSLVDSYAQMRQIASSSVYFSSSPKRVSASSSEVHIYIWTEKPFPHCSALSS